MQYTLDFNQRWSQGRTTYRPPFDPIRTRDYDAAELSDDTTARDFVCQHHYSRSYPAARIRVGLYRHGSLEGVAVFSHPCSNAVLTNVFDVPPLAAIELGRFVLLDSVAGNGETWFLARCFEILRLRGILGVVSFSDPLQRTAATGELIHTGHVGTIYQAHNGIYLGRGTSRTLHILPDGRVFSDRAAQKIRAGERGWKYAAAQLESLDVAPAPVCCEERTAWLSESLARVTRTIRHKGNHKYAWPLTPKMRAQLPKSLPYPKAFDTPAPWRESAHPGPDADRPTETALSMPKQSRLDLA
jgi:hypothetical protein